jgi:pyruvate,water dikinase
MIIESVFGLGEAIVSGRVEPDTYILDKPGPRLLSVRQSRQKFKIVRGPDGADIEPPLDESEADRRSLSQAEIIAIAELGLRAERHYGTRQDLEWARAAGATYLVQSRPITTLGAQAASEPHPAAPASAAPALLLSGLAALITDGGGVTCHAAIVSRELQLPCVVGTGNATTSLRTGATCCASPSGRR